MNFMYMPRVYIICLAIKFLRFRKAKPTMIKLLKLSCLGVDKSNLIITLSNLFLIVHLIGNMWAAASTFNITTDANWMVRIGIQDDNDKQKYIASVYWAVVTVLTVGYGDIIPVNVYEKVFTCIILAAGVAIFSYMLSSMGNQFSELSRSVSKRQSRDRQIVELETKFRLPDKLVEKIEYYFS